MLGSKVTSVRDFEKDTIRDIEGDVIPKQKMSIFELADGSRIAVRGSGTEPKIKYYLFGQRRPQNDKFSAPELEKIKTEIDARLDAVWGWVQTDVQVRLGK